MRISWPGSRSNFQGQTPSFIINKAALTACHIKECSVVSCPRVSVWLNYRTWPGGPTQESMLNTRFERPISVTTCGCLAHAMEIKISVDFPSRQNRSSEPETTYKSMLKTDIRVSDHSHVAAAASWSQLVGSSYCRDWPHLATTLTPSSSWA